MGLTPGPTPLPPSAAPSAGGIWKAVQACTEVGGNCFALFLGSQRSWKRPALDPKAAAKFQEQRSLHEIDPAHILPHGSYLMNCGSPKTGESDVGGGGFPSLIDIYLFTTLIYSTQMCRRRVWPCWWTS